MKTEAQVDLVGMAVDAPASHYVGILQQVLCVDRREVALAGPEYDGYDVHAHLVDQARGKHLATDVASSDLGHAVTRELLRLGHG